MLSVSTLYGSGGESGEGEEVDIVIEYATRAPFHTRHCVEKYETYFQSAQAAFCERFPGARVRGNPTPEANGRGHRELTMSDHLGPLADVSMPRLGAFEVTVSSRKTGPTLIFSKLQLGRWPNIPALVQRAEQILHGKSREVSAAELLPPLLLPRPLRGGSAAAATPVQLPGRELRVQRIPNLREPRAERAWVLANSPARKARDLKEIDLRMFVTHRDIMPGDGPGRPWPHPPSIGARSASSKVSEFARGPRPGRRLLTASEATKAQAAEIKRLAIDADPCMKEVLESHEIALLASDAAQSMPLSAIKLPLVSDDRESPEANLRIMDTPEAANAPSPSPRQEAAAIVSGVMVRVLAKGLQDDVETALEGQAVFSESEVATLRPDDIEAIVAAAIAKDEFEEADPVPEGGLAQGDFEPSEGDGNEDWNEVPTLMLAPSQELPEAQEGAVEAGPVEADPLPRRRSEAGGYDAFEDEEESPGDGPGQALDKEHEEFEESHEAPQQAEGPEFAVTGEQDHDQEFEETPEAEGPEPAPIEVQDHDEDFEEPHEAAQPGAAAEQAEEPEFALIGAEDTGDGEGFEDAFEAEGEEDADPVNAEGDASSPEYDAGEWEDEQEDAGPEDADGQAGEGAPHADWDDAYDDAHFAPPAESSEGDGTGQQGVESSSSAPPGAPGGEGEWTYDSEVSVGIHHDGAQAYEASDGGEAYESDGGEGGGGSAGTGPQLEDDEPVSVADGNL